MTNLEQLIGALRGAVSLHTNSYSDNRDLNAAELMAIDASFHRLLIEEIHAAPCLHNSEVNYETVSGKFCGICQRRIEEAA